MAHDGYLSEWVDGRHLGTAHQGWHEIVWHLLFLKSHADNPDITRKRRSDDLNPAHYGFSRFAVRRCTRSIGQTAAKAALRLRPQTFERGRGRHFFQRMVSLEVLSRRNLAALQQ